MPQFDFYSEAAIARPYFYDMLSGRTSPPPRETLERMMDVLEKRLPPDEKRRAEYINRAAINRGEIPCDINEMIIEHPECRDGLRTTLKTMFVAEK